MVQAHMKISATENYLTVLTQPKRSVLKKAIYFSENKFIISFKKLTLLKNKTQ